MIPKIAIMDRVAEWGIRPETVEKDYVLGWVLAAIAVDPELSKTWIFKGGTSLKKCVIETFRFSEDLDFTLTPDASYTTGAIQKALARVAEAAGEMSGLEIDPGSIAVKALTNRQGKPTFEARLYYRGPLGRRQVARILVDLTNYELLSDPPGRHDIAHPYPDALPDNATVATYTANELLAEKLRALFERTRPRDLYDVVFLLDNVPELFNLARAREIFADKCTFKGLAVPGTTELLGVVREDLELASEWANMLAHQVPVLPNFDAVLSRLPDLVQWISEPRAQLPAAGLPPIPLEETHRPLVSPHMQFWGAGLLVERIRFAAANRLTVHLRYRGRELRVEPYVFGRRNSDDRVDLFAWDLGRDAVVVLAGSEIQVLTIPGSTFTPRYRVGTLGIRT